MACHLRRRIVLTDRVHQGELVGDYSWRDQLHYRFNLNVSRVVIHMQADLSLLPAVEPPAGVKIRQASPDSDEDAEAWVALVNDAYSDAAETVDSYREHWRRHAFLAVQDVYLVSLEGAPAATITMGHYRSNPAVCGDARIAVAQRFQRRGLGRWLIAHGFAVCREAGFEFAESAITHTRTESIRLHLACGFVPQFDRKLVQHRVQRRLWPAWALAERRVEQVVQEYYRDRAMPYVPR